ncbi:siroheme synthase middle domains-like protein [Dendrothele bispora CBS 962.96]|uniref:precorrin-2 dehydrogenase n=1 Tax=Dendrothele bispora (strain CBS 962.96) TaxID=1314807 RepID=A0A4S8LE81_DENBC|nr:siroheme synthase middle domains-like protein [Dendrothele bispora CBS 962.96]
MDLSLDPNLGGGSLLIAWQLKDKNVLIVGGGEVASQRVESILVTDARITVLSPEKGLSLRTKRFLELYPDRIVHYDRPFTGSNELENMDMVLTAIDDNNLSLEIVGMCRKAKIPVNAADIPDLCDFYFGAQIRDGPLQIMISTNGQGPRLSALIKQKVQGSLTGFEGEALRKVGELRQLLKVYEPGVGGAAGRKRMKWMTQLCNQWEMEEFASMDADMMKRIMEDGWMQGRCPTFEEVGGKSSRRTLAGGPQTISSWSKNLLIPSLSFVAGLVVAGLISIPRRR